MSEDKKETRAGLHKQLVQLRQRIEKLEADKARQDTEIALLRAQILAVQNAPDPLRPIGPEPWVPKVPDRPIYVSPNTAPSRIVITADTARSDAEPSA